MLRRRGAAPGHDPRDGECLTRSCFGSTPASDRGGSCQPCHRAIGKAAHQPCQRPARSNRSDLAVTRALIEAAAEAHASALAGLSCRAERGCASLSPFRCAPGRAHSLGGDARVLRLVRRFLEAGMMQEGLVELRTESTPRGGPLSPLLSNILLNDLDRELEEDSHFAATLMTATFT